MVENSKLKILIITPHFPPDGGPSAQLFYLLSRDFVRKGHEVVVICAVPHYPSGIVPLDYRNFSIKKETCENIIVTRVPLISLNRKNLYLRLLQFINMQIGMAISSIKYDPDIIIASNPALQTGLPFLIMSILKSAKRVFSIHDFYPDIGIRLGVFRHSLVIKMIELIELKCLEKADAIRVLSESFIPLVKRYQKIDNKLFLIYDWVDTEFLKPKPKDNTFSKLHDLDNSFNILYAGNIGYSQGLEIVLKAAKLLENDESIKFIIVGDGPEKEKLLNFASKWHLRNIKFFPFQPREMLPFVLSTGDICLVCLKKGMAYTSLPSKIYSLLACGRPIIGCLDEGSDSWNLIKRANAGICIRPEDHELLASSIMYLKNKKSILSQFSLNGRKYCELNFSVDVASRKFEELFYRLISYKKERK